MDSADHLYGDLSGLILRSAVRVHEELGPGLLEVAYRACLVEELRSHGVAIREEVPIALKYRGRLLDCGFRADLIVEDKVLVELKAVEKLTGVHTAQVLTYLKLTQLRVGLLLNFNVTLLRHGIRRVVL